MDEQHQSEEDPQNRGPAVKSSIKKLKDKFVPGVKYGLLITAALNFSMLVIGCINVHKCDVNKNIPLFLIATGAIGLTSKFVSYIRERISRHMQVKYLESALYGVEIIFYVLGSIWVYKEFQPSYDPRDKGKYCDKTTYLFAFIYLTVNYIIIIATILGFSCFVCCAACLAVSQKNSYDVESQRVNAEMAEARETLTNTTKTEAEAK